MAVRNFYVEADIDGRETMLGGGPRAKDDGMTVHIHQRENGEIISDLIKIRCKARDGILTTEVYDPDGNLIFEYSSAR